MTLTKSGLPKWTRSEPNSILGRLAKRNLWEERTNRGYCDRLPIDTEYFTPDDVAEMVNQFKSMSDSDGDFAFCYSLRDGRFDSSSLAHDLQREFTFLRLTIDRLSLPQPQYDLDSNVQIANDTSNTISFLAALLTLNEHERVVIPAL
jgi:hypothetical protein